MSRIKSASIFKILLLHLHLFLSINAAPSAITDFDECMQPGICSQFCSNEEGGFECSCDVGYLTDPKDPTRCKAAEGHASLLFAENNDYIRHVALDGQEMTTIVKNTRTTLALDFEFRTGMIFWSDRRFKIYKAPIDKGNETTVVIDSGESYGLAVDWIYNHIYWTDYYRRTIRVANSEGDVRKTLINDDLRNPYAIAVDPLEGWMFWTDSGRGHARIERAGMDGSHRSTIIETDVKYAIAITLDLVGKKLYWVDKTLRIIASCNYDGSGRRTILHSHDLLSDAAGITTFEDYIYWTRSNEAAIYKANKFNDEEVERVTPLRSLEYPKSVLVYHPSRQPDGTNQCRAVDKHCSHLSLPAPRFYSKSPRLRCACPDGLRLLSDGLTCVANDSKSEVSASPETADVRKEVGQFASISCSMPINCATDLEWIKIGHPEKTRELKSMTSELRFDSVIKMTLNFAQVKHDDNGTYACRGPKRERFDGTERTLTVTDVPEVTITVAEPTSNGEIHLKWTVNDTHNEPIIDYTIEYQKQDQPSEWTVHADHAAAENTSVYLQGLEIGTSYRVRVSATNSVGKSLLHTYPHCITTMVKDTEYVPRISVDNKTDDSIIISLEPPPEDLKENNYIYKLRIAGGNESAEQSSTTDLNQRTISFRNLESGITYRIKASACLDGSTEKCGRWSEEEVQTLNEDSKAEELTTSENNIHFYSVPKVTTITPAKAIAAGEVYLNWTVNAVEDTDLEIRGYYKLRTVAKNFTDTFHKFMSTIMRTIQ